MKLCASTWGANGHDRTIDHADPRRHLAAISYFGWVSVIQRHLAQDDPLSPLARGVDFITRRYLPAERFAAMTEQDRLRIIAATIAEIRPMVQKDGGDLELAGVDGHRVLVHLKGQCLSCALAGQTLGGIRRKLMAALNEPVMVVPAPLPVSVA